MFKLFRIFKLNDIIINLNITLTQKTYAFICKLLLYLMLWFHSLACGWWIVIKINANVQYFKKAEGVKGYDYCVYENTGVVYNISGTDTPLPCDDRDSVWSGPMYSEDKWKRYTNTDRPFGYAWETSGALPWNEMN